jgi:hypothetical protein
MSKHVCTFFDNFLNEEFLGFSKEEKETKALNIKKELAKKEIENFNIEDLFVATTIKIDKTKELEYSKNILTKISNSLKIYKELFPELFQIDNNNPVSYAYLTTDNKWDKPKYGLTLSTFEFIIYTDTNIISNKYSKQQLIKKLQ